MPLPEVKYYALDELSRRWGVPKRRVKHCIETRQIDCCVWLQPCLMRVGGFNNGGNGEEVFQPREKRWVKEPVRVRAHDCRYVFRYRKAKVACFAAVNQSDSYLQPEEDALPTLQPKDLIILKEDVEQFEATYHLKPNGDFENDLAPSRFNHSDNYQTITMRDKEFRFGYVQSRIVRELHHALLTGDPWVHGKTLLDKAGSQSQQVKNVFSSKADWRELIESDRRGYYRLRV